MKYFDIAEIDEKFYKQLNIAMETMKVFKLFNFQ